MAPFFGASVKSDAMPVAAAVEMIRATPAERRSDFARDIWERRRAVWLERAQRFGSVLTGFAPSLCTPSIRQNLIEPLKKLHKFAEPSRILLAKRIGIEVHYVIANLPHLVEFFDKDGPVNKQVQFCPSVGVL